jgi:type II secretory pathway pseudopilin PulG
MKALSIGKTPYRVGNRGVATLEILIAFAILIMSMTAVILVVFSNQSASIDTQTNEEAVYKAQALLEQARALSRDDFSSVVSIAPTQDGIYQKTLDVTSIDSSTKKIVSTVTWTTAGRTLSVNYTTLLTSPITGAFCNPTPAGDWKNPQHWDFSATGLVPGNQSNGLGVADLKVYKKNLYLSAYTPMNNDYTFIAFSLPTGDPSVAPTFLGGVDTNPNSTDGINAEAIAPLGSNIYAYLASAHTANFATCTQGASCSQLQIVDATSPITSGWNPTIKSFKVPGVTGSGGQGIGKSIYYEGGYVYLGLTKTLVGPEFDIIDVHDPLNPFLVGSYPVGRTVNSIYIQGNYAYLATTDNTKELIVLDISNKSAPSAVGSFNSTLNDAVGNTSGLGNSIFISGSAAYLGRTYSLSNNDPEFYILNSTNPATTLPVLGSKDIGTSGNADSVNSIVVRNSLAFLITNKQFQVWDISNTSNIQPWTSDGTTNTFLSLSAVGGSGTTFNCSNNYFYTAIATSQGNNKDYISVIGPGGIPPTISLAVHDTSHNVITTATAGDSVHAGAVVSGSIGNPTGNVLFTYYTNASCTGAGSGAGTVSLLSGVADPSTLEGPLSTGSYSFKAHYNGDYQYSALDSSCMPLTVAKADQTITVTTHAPASAAYNSTFSVAAGASSGLAVAITTTGGCSISGGTVTMSSPSTSCVVHYNQAGNTNYNAASEVTETTTATKATPVLTWANPAAITYGTALGATQLNATAGGVAGTFTYTPASGTVLPVGAGQILSVHFVPTNTTNYFTPPDKTTSINVIKANQSITFNALANKTLGNADFAVSASASSALAVTFSSLTGSVCTVSASNVHIVSAGTCTIRASQAGNSNYNAAPNVDQSFTVAKATPALSTVIYNNTTNVPLNPQTTVLHGTAVYDKATLTSVAGVLPTGTITFTFYTKKTSCSSTNQTSGVALAGGVANSAPYTTQTSDTISYQVSYSGDANYNAVSGSCQALTAI